MTQGRLPVGPGRVSQNQSSSAPAAQDERIARKVETIRHVLRLERDQNHANRAVIGGLDAFLERWIEDPDIKLTLRTPASACRAMMPCRPTGAPSGCARPWSAYAILSR